ncbi:MAG: protein translocase SEC61 complex subunit gamma [Candidatus Nezhaarchaeales archaeon]
MGKLKEWLEDLKRVLVIARKPGRSEYWLLLKICLLGMTVLGVYGFVVMMIAWLVTMTITGG